MINRGNVLNMPRDEMTLLARYDNTKKSLKWSSNVRDGDYRDDDKILCNNVSYISLSCNIFTSFGILQVVIFDDTT